MEPEKRHYSWEEYQKDITTLADTIRRDAHRIFDGVYGIPRGGLILAVSLSHALNLPLIVFREKITKNTLIVDDIADKGTTLDALFKEHRFRPVTATLFYHEQSLVKPDFYAQTKQAWVVFPWETESTSRYDGTTL